MVEGSSPSARGHDESPSQYLSTAPHPSSETRDDAGAIVVTRKGAGLKEAKSSRRVRIRPLEMAVPPDTLRPLLDNLDAAVEDSPELATVVAAMNEPSKGET